MPAQRLLRSAGIKPADVNDAFDRRAAARAETFLRPGYPYPALVRKRTGVPLVTIARRRRHIYVVVEWRDPLVRYVEHARDDCRLIILKQLPASAQLAACGEPLTRLVYPPSFLDGLYCTEILWVDPFTEVRLRPAWTAYDLRGSNIRE